MNAIYLIVLSVLVTTIAFYFVNWRIKMINQRLNHYKLDVILNSTLYGIGKVDGDRELLNWYQGRAQGSIRMAEFLNVISPETSNLLRETIDGWYEHYIK